MWPGDLKARVALLFEQRAISHPSTNVNYLPVARFVSTLYDLNVLDKDIWPTARIIEDMHERGYARDVFTKASYGAEPPPPLSLNECYKWIAHYRIVSLNS